MLNKCLLHQSKLGAFKLWLFHNNVPYRDGKGPYQVIQVMTEASGWQVVFSTAHNTEHFTVNKALMPLVKRFIEESRDEYLPDKPA